MTVTHWVVHRKLENVNYSIWTTLLVFINQFVCFSLNDVFTDLCCKLEQNSILCLGQTNKQRLLIDRKCQRSADYRRLLTLTKILCVKQTTDSDKSYMGLFSGCCRRRPKGRTEWTRTVQLVLRRWYWMKPTSSLPSQEENRFWIVKPAARNSLGVNMKQRENTT